MCCDKPQVSHREMMNEVQKNWSDAKKFLWETGRTVALALVALWIINPGQNSLQYKTQVDIKKIELKSKVVDEFLANAYAYTSVAHDACLGSEEAGKQFKNDAYDKYMSALNRLEIYLGSDKVNAKAIVVRKLSKDLFEYCKKRDVPKSQADGKNKEDEFRKGMIGIRESLELENNELAKDALSVIEMS